MKMGAGITICWLKKIETSIAEQIHIFWMQDYGLCVQAVLQLMALAKYKRDLAVFCISLIVSLFFLFGRL